MIDRISLITGNEGKAREYESLLGIKVTAVKENLIEIQELDVVRVVERKAQDAYSMLRRPVLVDDTGLTLTEWNGLPGALVFWFLDTIGPQGILKMAANVTNRRATVTTAIGYADESGVQVFTGTLNGTLTTELRGTTGFGYDPIFIPDGHDRTFAEMSSEEKNSVSHRRLAVDELRKALNARYQTGTAGRRSLARRTGTTPQAGGRSVLNVIGAHLYVEDADGRVLLGLRHPDSAYAPSTHHFLAGHCEQESAIACIVREAREEAGLEIDPDDVEFAHAVHLVDAPGTQPRMQMVFRARRWKGTPTVLEPGKCLSWNWWHPDALPEPIVGYTRVAIEGIQAGRLYSEIGWP
ncbi:RdgB/HAM1 family non-canonical purine NTP pyrophosphatase [Actinoallomurus sp. NPDC052274]|uniref:RdgB/HAM1 family non-canonical purine NTP pyrophosphatase n=1 Tax=Actinoallomurus sp. NPDC052274 TaxID=3155420 RepID=UPI0034210DB7